ncbi:DNA polymerase III subunit delta [Halolactibacillus miurensis]|uniref:DNA polymerase III subunit delta n=1 Tax=Halolactibacillus miurensis TaxID=306541 RepID=A0A1I6PNJ2_9BACI|nr:MULTISPECIES: DNA polymerase III subunit delta [Halolactibacillus]GEM03728.1 DNA polymerase III subunit delta [Halolactibacillus miurensis]SFS41762.1 DNA polymerase III, delta subunit [Halolactibacillus miurensis]
MHYLEAKKQIKKIAKQPVIVIYGDEQFLIESLIQSIVDVILTEAEKEEQLITYDMEEQPLADAILEAETFPFFGGNKIVVCEGSYFLTGKKVRTPVEHDLDRFIDYLEQPVDFSTLIIVVPYEKLDERKKVVKALKKQGDLLECKTIIERDLSQWFSYFKQQYQIDFSKRIEDLLIQEVGTSLQLLEKEIEKLSLFQGTGAIIDEDAKALISHSAKASSFTLVDAVMNRDLSLAINTYKDLVRLNEEEIGLLALLSSQIRTIYQVKTLLTKGYSQKQIAQQIKVHPYVVKMSETRAKRFNLNQLYQALDLCAETDYTIKQGKMDKRLAFEMLLYQLVI